MREAKLTPELTAMGLAAPKRIEAQANAERQMVRDGREGAGGRRRDGERESIGEHRGAEPAGE